MTRRWVVAALAALALLSASAGSRAASQDLLAESVTPATPMDAVIPDAAEQSAYADAKKAIHEGRWADAVKMLEGVIARRGTRADSALYWKAYAENKLGQSATALQTCSTLKSEYASSTWAEDCGALTIEIKASKGEAVQPKAEQSDELKLLALVTLMQRDPKLATEQIKEIIAGDGSEKLKEGAVFILGRTVPEQVYPQIVRISYLEGDVRIARVSENEKSRKAAWEAAVMNLPLNEGDSLATGKDGRVEIEMEDASTIYLGENSVLNCIDLHTTGGVPHSDLALVSGTMTLHLDSLMGGETFVVRTPTEYLLSHAPEKVHLRLTSYLDGIAITPLGTGALNVQGAGRQELTTGRTLYFSDGHRVSPEQLGKTQDLAAFDAWVADRFGARSSADTELMKVAGLTKPIPGLAEMKDKGHFFECPPYGMCWQPDAPGANALLTAPTPPAPTPKSATKPATASPSMAAAWFPCLGTWYPTAGLLPMQVPAGYNNGAQSFGFGYAPYDWAVCHAGTWIPYNDSYAWVAGGRRHHQCPVHWVRLGDKPGVVPIHPRDVKGNPPVNRGLGFIPVKGRDGVRATPIKIDPGRPVQVIKSEPREFRNAPQPILPRATPPQMEGRALRDNVKAGLTGGKPVPITLTHEQGFVSTRQIMQGGHPVAVGVPIGRVGGVTAGVGSARASSPGFGAAGGGGFSHGGVSAGGGSMQMGGVSGGGGGIVTGGGGVHSVGGGAPASAGGGSVSVGGGASPSVPSSPSPK